MKPLLTLTLFFFLIRPSLAQKETNNWLYGSNAGNTFVNGNLQPLPGITNGSFFVSTTYSDANGNLKFVFTGSRVLDRNYNVMPGSLLIRSGAGFHIVLAAASPANANQFYLFYVSQSAGQYTLRYAIIDMSLNGGLGQVISADQPVDSNISGAFTLIQKKGTSDFWIVTHLRYTDKFHSWLVTATGVSATPVSSQAGTNNAKSEYDFIDMKASPNGEMIAGITYTYYPATFSYDARFVEVFNIDSYSGQITNRVKSRRSVYIYQNPSYLEFSPDNRLLYVAYSYYAPGLQPCGYAATNLFQFNLCYTDSVSFTQYACPVYTTFSFCYMLYMGQPQLAPNKKIYIRYGSSMSAVDTPNIIGSHCKVNFNIYTPNGSGGDNLPTFYHAYIQKAVINNIVYTGGCFPNPLHFKITNDTINNVQWNFGDAASGGNNVSGNKEADHVFSAPGYYTVTASLYASDGSQIETLSTPVEIKDPARRLLYNYPKDTVICATQMIKLKLDVINGIFAWSKKMADGSAYFDRVSDSFEITSTGTYYVDMMQNDCNGCKLRDSINVTVLPTPNFSLGNDTYICTGDSLKLSVYAPGADFLWTNGDQKDFMYVKRAGTYWVTAEFNHNGCPQSDTIIISERPKPVFSLPNDTILCNNQTLLLNPGIANATYKWQNYSSAGTFNVTSPGKYWVQATSNSCSYSDTIEVNYISAQTVYLGQDTALCSDASLQLTANVSNVNYLWNTGEATASIVVKTGGQYWVKTNNGTCTVSDTINVTFNPVPVFSLGNDTVICENSRLVLNTGIANASYLWQDGSTNNSFSTSFAGQYWAAVTQKECTYRDTLMVGVKPLVPVFLGNDTAICADATLLLHAANSQAAGYSWQDHSSFDTYLVNAQGTYWVQVTGLNGCMNADTIHVYKNPLPDFTLGKDTTLCDQQQLTYNFNMAGATYLWNNGNKQALQVIQQPGIYWLEVSQLGCKKRDSIDVSYQPLPAVYLGSDTTLCEGVTYQLDPHSGNNARYTWQNNSTAPVYEVTVPGTYWVRVIQYGCAKTDSVKISYKLKPVFDLGADTYICQGQTLTLQPAVTGAVAFLWQDGSTHSSYTVTKPGTYALTLTNECGINTDKISIIQGLCALNMPNAFTPNGDGKNDVFGIKFPWYIKEFHMMVFNRWGEKVFDTYTPSQGWNGMYKGIDQPAGAYVWYISLTDKDGKTDSGRGTVMLLR